MYALHSIIMYYVGNTLTIYCIEKYSLHSLKELGIANSLQKALERFSLVYYFGEYYNVCY